VIERIIYVSEFEQIIYIFNDYLWKLFSSSFLFCERYDRGTGVHGGIVPFGGDL